MQNWENIASVIGSEKTELLKISYENAQMDGLCHAGTWEITRGNLPSFAIPPELLNDIEILLKHKALNNN